MHAKITFKYKSEIWTQEPRQAHSCMTLTTPPDAPLLPASSKTEKGASRGDTKELATDPHDVARTSIAEFGIWSLLLPSMPCLLPQLLNAFAAKGKSRKKKEQLRDIQVTAGRSMKPTRNLLPGNNLL